MHPTMTRPPAIPAAARVTTTVQDACDAALAGLRAQSVLSAYLDGLRPDHPGRRSVAEAMASMRLDWVRLVDVACRLPAATQADLVGKASIISRLVERDGQDRVIGGPALALAASLADDILARPCMDATRRTHP